MSRTEDKFSIEIIVATSDGISVKRLSEKYPSVNTVEIRGGPARKRNVATRFASGDYFAFFDDDVEVTPYSIFHLFECVNQKDIGMAYGKLRNLEFQTRFDEAGSFLTWSGFLWARAESGVEDRGQFDNACPILAGKSAACIVHRKVFWNVGGFDESYEILGEETDLSWRIWLSGFKVLYCPRSVTYHAFNTRFKPNDFYVPRRVYYNGCRNYISMLLTNLEAKNLLVPIFVQFNVWFLAGLGMILTGKWEAGINIFKGLCYIIENLPTILEKRKSVQTMRTIGDSELLPIITHNPPLSYYWRRFFHYIKTGRHG